MKVSELGRIAKHVQRFLAVENLDGSFVLYVFWFDGQDMVENKLKTARGKDKIFKSPATIFNFLRSVGNYGKLDISFLI